MPSQSVATNACDRELAGLARAAPRRAGRRDDELHAALVVLRRVVVPVGEMGHDLADDGSDGLRFPRTPSTSTSISVADELLDEHLVVVAAGKLDRAARARPRPHLRDPDRRAEPRRLHEHRVAERVLDRVAGPQSDVSGDGDPLRRASLLEEVLVHAERRRGARPGRRTGRSRARGGPAPSRPRRTARGGSAGRRRTPRAWRASRAVGTGSVSRAAPGAARGRPWRGGSSQRPSRPISIVVHVVALGVERRDDGRAEASEISCSLDRPPASTATRRRGLTVRGVAVVSVSVVVSVVTRRRHVPPRRRSSPTSRPRPGVWPSGICEIDEPVERLVVGVLRS